MRLRTIYEKTFGWRVFSGPFRGLRYVPEAVGSLHAPKLLGTYEREIHSQVEALIARNPDVIINIGAGEGYYAVGLAHRLKQARVIAFESDPRGRMLTSQLAALNHVAGRVEVRGSCRPFELASVLRGAVRPAIVIDVEGAEAELLDPELVPDLVRAAILVEVHDFVSSTVGDLLIRRFTGSHRPEEVWSQPRTAYDLPGLAQLAVLSPWRAQAVDAMNEQRPGPMRWFLLVPQAT